MTKELEPGSRILIAEDDLVSRRMLQVFLAKWGYEVVVARDGREALQTLEADGAPSLAILDWMMPGLEGPEVCRRVRHHPGRRYTYILLLTARTQKDDLLRGLESGADDYLTKPFDAQSSTSTATLRRSHSLIRASKSGNRPTTQSTQAWASRKSWCTRLPPR